MADLTPPASQHNTPMRPLGPADDQPASPTPATSSGGPSTRGQLDSFHPSQPPTGSSLSAALSAAAPDTAPDSHAQAVAYERLDSHRAEPLEGYMDIDQDPEAYGDRYAQTIIIGEDGMPISDSDTGSDSRSGMEDGEGGDLFDDGRSEDEYSDMELGGEEVGHGGNDDDATDEEDVIGDDAMDEAGVEEGEMVEEGEVVGAGGGDAAQGDKGMGIADEGEVFTDQESARKTRKARLAAKKAAGAQGQPSGAKEDVPYRQERNVKRRPMRGKNGRGPVLPGAGDILAGTIASPVDFGPKVKVGPNVGGGGKKDDLLEQDIVKGWNKSFGDVFASAETEARVKKQLGRE